MSHPGADEDIDQREAAQRRGAVYTAILITHVALIILTLSFFAGWHLQVWPYRVTSQNGIELLLFVCNTTILVYAQARTAAQARAAALP